MKKGQEVGIVEQWDMAEHLLVQSSDEVEAFNSEYGTDYSYFIIQRAGENPIALLGMYTPLLKDNVYFVSSL